MKVQKLFVFILIPIIVLVIFSVYLGIRKARGNFFYPKPKVLPPNIDTPLEIVLTQLDNTLAKKSPLIASRLQKGLSPKEIDELEIKSGIKLTEELRSLYMWHNGIPETPNQQFFPGHLFLPLDVTIERHIQIKKDVSSSSMAQRAFFNIFAGHKLSWLTIFDDMCGDGYYYDHLRKDENSCFFYNFAESGYYIFFPSLKNLLAGITECYQQDVYKHPADPNYLEEDYEKSQEVLLKYGSEI